jgi:hypothetical protein
MDSFIFGYFLVKFIRVFNRTIFHAGSASRALILLNISGLSGQAYFKITSFTLYTINFSVTQDFYIRVPSNLDELRCKYSDRAVISGKGLVKLSHVAADGRGFINQINLKTRSGEVERSLNTTDSSTNYHYVSEITTGNTATKLFNLFFFHVSMSLSAFCFS